MRVTALEGYSERPGAGLVASLAQPGGNITGLSMQWPDTAGKRLELLREVVPGLRRLAIMVNVGHRESVLDASEAQAAAQSLGLEIATLEIRRAGDIVPAFESLKDHADALYVTADALLNANRFWREVETQKLEQLEARMDEIADRVAHERNSRGAGDNQHP